MEKLKVTFEPKSRKTVKAFCLSEEAIEKLKKISKKSNLSLSEVVNQLLLKISA